MKITNKDCTKFYSDKQEKWVAQKFCGIQVPASGGGRFRKGDVLHKPTMLFECKTTTSPKESFSIKKEWIEKNKQEAFSQRVDNSCVVFNFEPDGENYYVIDTKLMKFLLEKLDENA